MVDGPFKNAPVSNDWKRYGETLPSEATSQRERTSHACFSMLGDVNIADFSSLITAVEAYCAQPQLHFFPSDNIAELLKKHPQSPLNNTYGKLLTANIKEGITLCTAAERALQSTTRHLIDHSENRLHEEIISLRARGKIDSDTYKTYTDRHKESFKRIEADKVSVALREGSRKIFKQELKKKTGTDEGPHDEY